MSDLIEHSEGGVFPIERFPLSINFTFEEGWNVLLETVEARKKIITRDLEKKGLTWESFEEFLDQVYKPGFEGSLAKERERFPDAEAYSLFYETVVHATDPAGVKLQRQQLKNMQNQDVGANTKIGEELNRLQTYKNRVAAAVVSRFGAITYLL